MKTYIIKRLIQAVGVCLVISMISFFLLLLNTDPALIGQALPLYWFGIMLIIILGVWPDWASKSTRKFWTAIPWHGR